MPRIPALLLLAVTPAFAQTPFSDLRYRAIGPNRGGRVTAVTGVPTLPLTFYMGSTGGGIWKTTDAGHNWRNISDGQLPVGSIGAIDVSLSDPDTIYAGTGSSKIRSNVSIGRGIFKSTDAGRTWTFTGLRDAGQIATVRIHPTNPDIAFVAAQGDPFTATHERGVYRTTDGGKSWKQVFFLSDLAGAADLELQPGNPNVVFACMWHAQRKPWTIISGAREGGIYRSADGGDTWNKLAGGLPNQLFGRSNVALSAAKPNRVYALIEAKPGSGLYRSEDSGATWSLVNGSPSLITRPFYYDTLGADPNNAEILYVGDEGWFKSTDGGKSFSRAPVPHGDNHDLWINPKDSNYMIQANDGGANVSVDGGRTWSTQNNQPTAEIYQVAVDNQYPYRLYGAQQDNTTVIIPSAPTGDGQEFRFGPGCETGPIIPDTQDAKIVYGGCKGQFSRQNILTNNEQRYWIGAESLYGNPGSDLIFRFQRVSPMEVSPHAPHTVYYCSQYVHRTHDGGVHWERISPDLTAHPEGTQGASGEPITRDATGEEVYSTIYAIRESRVQQGVIWAGSNDGLVHVTRDDGKTWANVTPGGLLPGGRVQNIEPSPHRAGTAYVAIYRYLLGDFAPYLYRTDDFGKSWTKITKGFAPDEPTRVVREDPSRPGLLYAGTEFGMHISFNNGADWEPFQLNLPATPVTDLRVAHQDLVLSTQGRGFYILDNLTPLHQTLNAVTLVKPREAVRTPGRGARTGAQIDYYLPTAATDVKIEILDHSGASIRTFTTEAPVAADAASAAADDEEEGPRFRAAPVRLDKTAGLHRIVWDLRYPGSWPTLAQGPVAVPGAYTVRLTAGPATVTQPLELTEDPRITDDGVTTADLQQQFEHNMRVRDLLSDTNRLVARAKADHNAALLERLVTPPIRYSKPGLQTQVQYLYSVANSSDQRPGEDVLDRYRKLREQLTILQR
ncbi:MAG: hypothetical protein M3Z09_08900 [Acidobacteriota bacterium]|nr:hypothetical protein [Acidobacteriota bacterium]